MLVIVINAPVSGIFAAQAEPLIVAVKVALEPLLLFLQLAADSRMTIGITTKAINRLTVNLMVNSGF